MSNKVLEKKISHWKQQLLDLSKRNRMINFKESRLATLKLTSPDCIELYDRIVDREEELSFKRVIDETANNKVGAVVSLLAALNEPIKVAIGDIGTGASASDMQRALRNLRSKAKLSLEEQGSNILYMCVGFIEWSSNKKNYKTRSLSPLILVPVTIQLPVLNSPYTLKRYDDEVVLNPTLSYLFSNELGYELPEFDSDEDNIEEYLDKVENFAEKQGWRLIREASIGLMSFQKISMYMDIENNMDRLRNNPVINALSGDTSMMDYSSVQLPETDSIHPKNNFEVLSADSSQQEAIQCSKHGLSFVMQGPPGTGKSQTIANIISEALADGKKVLFVSEKMAALQVVYRRLQETHIADFCLPLHSYKANKKEVIEQLGRNLDLPKLELMREVGSIQETLFSTRNELNNYVSTLHKKTGTAGLSCYEIYTKLTELKDADAIDFDLPDVENIDSTALYTYLRELEKYEEAVINIGFNVKDNPWRNFRKDTVGIEYLNRFSAALNELHDIYAGMIPLVAEIESVYHIEESYLFENYDELIENLPEYSLSGDVSADWFTLDDYDVLIGRINDIRNYTARMRELLADIETDFSGDIIDKDMGAWLAGARSAAGIIKRIADTDDKGIFTDTDILSEQNREILSAVSVMKETLEKIRQIYSISLEDTIEYAEKASQLTAILSKGGVYLPNWFEASSIADKLETAGRFSDYSEKIRRYENNYSAEWENGVIGSDNGEILVRFRDRYNSSYLNDTLEKLLGVSTDNLGIFRKHIDELDSVSGDLVNSFAELCNETGISLTATPENIFVIRKLSEILEHDAPLIKEWFAPDTDHSGLMSDITEAKRLSDELFCNEEEILSEWKSEALDLDCDSILKRYETEYKSIFRFFNSLYREDRKNVRSLSKDEQVKINDDTIVSLLNRLKERKGISEKLSEMNITGKAGKLYNGHDTDWESIRSGIKLAERISGLLGNVPKAFCERICSEEQKTAIADKVRNIAEIISDARIRTDEICAVCGIELSGDYSQSAYKIHEAYEFISSYDKEYESDRTYICRYSKNENRYYPDEYLQSLLEAASAYREASEAFSAHNEKLCNYFGTLYNGQHTEWRSILCSLNNAEKIVENFGQLSPETVSIICGSEKIESLGSLSGVLNSAMLKFERNSYYAADRDIKRYSFDLIIEDTSKIRGAVMDIHELVSETDKFAKDRMNACDIMKAAGKIAEYRRLRTECSKAAEYLKLYLTGIAIDENTDLEELTRQLKLLKSLKTTKLPVEFYGVIASDREKRLRLPDICAGIKALDDKLKEKLDWVDEQFDDTQDLNNMTYSQSYEFIAQCLQYFDKLEFWIDFRRIRQECCDGILRDYILKTEENELFDHIRDSFLRAYYMKLLDHIFSEEPALSGFKRNRHENVIEKFRENDNSQLFAAQAKLRSKLTDQLPDPNSLIRVNDEVSVLQKEMNKRQKHMPLRKLFRRIPNLLMRLKPCLMMSPLSVSYFLEAQSYNFDLVIFDEASQILPEDAIGAILRGKQVIIAGDIKQMPPTSFFSSSVGGAETDTDDDSEEADDEILSASILEEAAGTLPGKTLLWHYRSRSEGLIAFSNSEIYNNRLVTFPDSTVFAKDMGVEYVYVHDGVYEGHGRNCNEKEAQKCVELLEKHIIEHPDRSLGIIAFSEKQQGVIQREVDNFRISNPEYESFFEKETDEPFFVKNLENVQGDERDTIIFSICYAKDISGRLYMRFGPLGHQGGERRLNVAVTRAKCNVKLVGSLLPEELDLNRVKSEGVRLLRKYIEFAIYGQSRLKNNRIADVFSKDGFCDEVAGFIADSGYIVRRSIGSSDNRIDIAVSAPGDPDSFIAGIECDGYSYKAARTARDRDSLRSSMLGRMGWNMYRVWSTEWICNGSAAKKQLLDFLNKASNGIEEQERVIVNDISGLVREVREEHDENESAYGLEKYTATPFSKLKPVQNIYDYTVIAEDISCVLSYEQPVSLNTLYKRMAYAFGTEKMTAKYKASIDTAIKNKLKGKAVLDKNGFLWSLPIKKPVPKIPADTESFRKAEDISAEEITELMKIVLSKAYGLEPNDLISECSAVYGYERRGARINTIMNSAIDKMKEDGIIELVDGKINLIGG